MGSSTEILEISSDEEVDFGDTTESSDFGVGGGEYEDVDYSLLSKLLGDIGDSESPQKLRIGPLKLSTKVVADESDDDDDDCVILDDDPDKPVVMASSMADNAGDDDLEIVGEKGEDKSANWLLASFCLRNIVNDGAGASHTAWLERRVAAPYCMAQTTSRSAILHGAKGESQRHFPNMVLGFHLTSHGAFLWCATLKPSLSRLVACRDFPHSRHLCATFPFASTPHALCCDQCHCYVCDVLAPCSHWGTGFSSIDHCHASDKDDFWRAERKRIRKGGRPLPVFPSIHGASPLEAPIQTIQVPALAPPHLNSLLQNQSLSPVTNHPHPVSSNVNVSNVVNQVRIHPSLCVVPRHEPQSQFSLQSQPTSNNNVASGDKIHNVESRSFQSFTPHAVFKQPSYVAASLKDSNSYGSQLSSDPSLQRCHSFQALVLNGIHGLTQQSGGSGSDHSAFHQPKISSPQSTDVSSAKYPPSQPQIHSEPYSSCLFRDPRHSQMPSQPYVNSKFVNEVPLQPQAAPKPSVKNSDNLILRQHYVAFEPDSPLPSQTLSSYQSADSGFGDQPLTRSMMSSRSHLASGFPSQSSQLQIHDNPTSLFVDGQNEMRQGNRTQNVIDASPTDFGYAWNSSLNHGNHQIHAELFPQCQGTAPADNSQLQSIAKDNYRQSMAPQDNFHPQTVAVADNSSLSYNTHSQFPVSRKPGSLKLQLDDWTFGSHSLPDGFEVMSPDWNVSSR
ncbi:hypothetical protein Sango_0309500 [Sesamum angolense]|uniref:Uncharacterized protein n=1 Tax=Sesamum angolense TaxID=2727404 RepID=A0AAE2C3F0_9LAMI|nr:hypothetical protein Sango_0309500 [Sesamum angolense]